MKSYLIFFALLLARTSEAQLNAAMKVTAARYFVSLPFGKSVTDFNTELKADSTLRKTPPALNGAPYRLRLQSTTEYARTDPSTIIPGKNGNYWRKRPVGGIVDNGFILSQEYRVAKEGISWSDWRKRCLAIVHDFGRDANVKELELSGGNKARSFVLSDWELGTPAIGVYFGEVPDAPFWFLTLELRFTPESKSHP